MLGLSYGFAHLSGVYVYLANTKWYGIVSSSGVQQLLALHARSMLRGVNW